MPKICINGHRFDTAKVSHHWGLERQDDRYNNHTGDVYRSSKGVWYVETPSQWANMHSWVIMTPDEILNEYADYLTDYDKEEITKVAGLDWD
jgi:hypothetical protein